VPFGRGVPPRGGAGAARSSCQVVVVGVIVGCWRSRVLDLDRLRSDGFCCILLQQFGFTTAFVFCSIMIKASCVLCDSTQLKPKMCAFACFAVP
jgi:hypothetical protein